MNQHNPESAADGVSRRNFLKSSSAAVVGGAWMGTLVSGRAAQGQGSLATIRVALVGCGGRGTGAADEALRTAGDVKLVAIADAFRDRLDGCYATLKEKHGARVDVPEERKFVGFDAYQKAMELADVVILATPPGFRPIHFEEAVRQGRHVFMEKPLATDAPGVRKVLAAAGAAKAKNLKVGVGLQRRHHPGYIETVKRLQDGAIGELMAMRCYWNGGGVWVRPRKDGQTEMEYQMRNWYYFTWLSGDHICEQHIHNLDVINWVKNSHPVRCQGMGGRQVRAAHFITDKTPITIDAGSLDYGEIFDHHYVEFEYPDGTRLHSQCRQMRGCWSSVSEHVQGTRGSCEVSAQKIITEKPWRFEGRKSNPYQQQHDDLFDAIRQNKPFNEAEFGAISTMTAILGRMATYSGKMVEWDEAIKSEVSLVPMDLSWEAAPSPMPDKNGLYPIAVPGETTVL